MKNEDIHIILKVRRRIENLESFLSRLVSDIFVKYFVYVGEIRIWDRVF